MALYESNQSNITGVFDEGKCGPVEERAVQAAIVNFGEAINRLLGQDDGGQS